MTTTEIMEKTTTHPMEKKATMGIMTLRMIKESLPRIDFLVDYFTRYNYRLLTTRYFSIPGPSYCTAVLGQLIDDHRICDVVGLHDDMLSNVIIFISISDFIPF